MNASTMAKPVIYAPPLGVWQSHKKAWEGPPLLHPNEAKNTQKGSKPCYTWDI